MSVIMPTHRRADSLAKVLQALALQTLPATDFEVVVVMDGADAPTERLLEKSSYPFQLRWFVRPKQGAPAARNFGVRQAEGGVLVFLDDDVVPVPEVLACHLAHHELETRLVVLGALAIHPDSPEKFLAEATDFTRAILERCSAPGYRPRHTDLPDANISIKKQHLDQVGGWDESFTGFGGLDDTEIGYRLKQSGLHFHFDAQALAYHYYVKSLARLLEDSRQVGRAQMYYFEKHPDRLCDLRFPPLVTGAWWKRAIFRLAGATPEFVYRILQAGVAPHVREWRPQRGIKLARVAVKLLVGLFLCRGFWEGSARMESVYRHLRQRIPILAYHRVAPRTDGDSVWSVPAEEFAAHMKWLADWGYRTVSFDDLCKWQTSLCSLPPKPVILAFDDGYRGLSEYVAPVLRRYGFGMTVFLIAGKLGSEVVWEDQHPMAIMSREEARDLAAMGYEFGVHGVAHYDWTRADREVVQQELRESARIVEDLTGRPARSVAYPFGLWNLSVRSLVEPSGFACACTVQPGGNDFNQDRFLLKRNLIMPGFGRWRLFRALHS